MRILVVEDERKVASFIRQGLVEEGHAVEVAADGAAALDAIAEGPSYDLVVLDVMLPKRDGFNVLKTLRESRVQTPVLLLTARDGVADKVTGLDLAPTTISPSRSPSRSSWPGCGPCCAAAGAGPSRCCASASSPSIRLPAR